VEQDVLPAKYANEREKKKWDFFAPNYAEGREWKKFDLFVFRPGSPGGKKSHQTRKASPEILVSGVAF